MTQLETEIAAAISGKAWKTIEDFLESNHYGRERKYEILQAVNDIHSWAYGQGYANGLLAGKKERTECNPPAKA